MDAIEELEEQIRHRLDEAAARQRDKQTGVRRDMEQLQQRSERLESVAESLLADVIRPRMGKLASLFTNAHLSDKDKQVGYGCVCRFDHTDAYPANTILTIGISADATVEEAIITYNLEILPIFFQFDGHDQLVVPVDTVNNEHIAAWIDGKLLQFTDTYLRIQVIEQYQQSSMVVDPVCGMRINRADAEATVDYSGRTYYFCVDQCRQKFLSSPDRYTTVRK
jgi:YHS domain-containing protein